MGVELGRLKDPEKTLHIFTMVYWAGAEKAEGFGQHVMFQIGTLEGVQEFVPNLAVLVKKYAVPLLWGDEDSIVRPWSFKPDGSQMRSSRGT
jgi:hypothetical protein